MSPESHYQRAEEILDNIEKKIESGELEVDDDMVRHALMTSLQMAQVHATLGAPPRQHISSVAR